MNNTTDKLSVKSITERLNSKTPPFWNKMRRWMIACGTIGIALAAIPVEHLLWVPEQIQHLDSILITIGVLGTTLSSLAAVSPEDKS